MAEQKRQLSIRLTHWEYDQLQAIGKVEDRGVNQVIRDAIYEYAFNQYQEAKQFLDSVDAGMLKPSTEQSEKHLQKLYHAFSAKCRVTKPLHDQRLLEEEYKEPVEGGE